MSRTFEIGDASIGGPALFVIAGPCVVESAELCLRVAKAVKEACAARQLPFVFKASYRKANRSSARSFQGLPIRTALEALARVQRECAVPVLIDAHEPEEYGPAA